MAQRLGDEPTVDKESAVPINVETAFAVNANDAEETGVL
jgi:hypothetical protein